MEAEKHCFISPYYVFLEMYAFPDRAEAREDGRERIILFQKDSQ